MRALWLDFQRPEPGRHRAGIALLAAGLGLSAILLVDYVNVLGRIDELEFQVSRLQRDTDASLRTAGDAERSPVRGVLQHAASDEPERSYRSEAQWENLFAALEAAAGDNVTLLSLHAGTGDIQIGGEAKNIGAATDYVKRLQSAGPLGNPHLTQSEVVSDHPQRPLRFMLAAQWLEGAP